jgi:hypothetical protein
MDAASAESGEPKHRFPGSNLLRRHDPTLGHASNMQAAALSDLAEKSVFSRSHARWPARTSLNIAR